jgi:dolichyl-phosphate-mannose-protein mannosyltransferase
MIWAPAHSRDPWKWNIALVLAFLGLACVRIGVPTTPFFDEIHYVPAARSFLDLARATNLEHPPLAKLIMAGGMAMFGDNPLGWRMMSLLFGTLALLAAMRAMWFASQTRAASLLTGVFAATNFLLFVHARIAMLDVFMAGFVMLALWMCAGAVRQNETARWRLAVAGASMGAAMACKWGAIPLAVLPGLAFLIARLWNGGVWSGRTRFLTTARGWPIGGMSLAEAGVWLGVLPLAVYALAFAPYLLFAELPGGPTGLIDLHRQMLEMQTQVPKPHPYQSVWWQWVINQRVIWYLYEVIDGAQRGVMLIGNPLTMLAGLPALVWCLWAWLRDRRRDCAAVVIFYAASLCMWVIVPKAVQFYFHYFLPGMFLSAALALATERLWRRGERLVPVVLVGGAVALFAYWFPILTAAPLAGDQAFLRWAWFVSWR